MKPINNEIRKKKIISFSILMFITGGVVFLLLSSLWQGDSKIAEVVNKVINTEDTQSDKLVQYDELLHGRLTGLQQLDEQYASLLTNAGSTKSLDSLNIVIHQEEEYFIAVTNRINQDIAAFTDDIKRKQFVKMIASFRSAILYREAINSLRNEISFNNQGLGSGAGRLLQLEDELEEKKSRIIMLENSVTILKKAKAPVSKMVKNKKNNLEERANKPDNRIVTAAPINKNLNQSNDESLLKQSSQPVKVSGSHE